MGHLTSSPRREGALGIAGAATNQPKCIHNTSETVPFLMRRFWLTIFLAAGLNPTSADLPHAQTIHGDVTIVSVLTMARNEAEKATTEEARIRLRRQVAQAIRNTGQEAAFGRYAADAFIASEALDRAQSPDIAGRSAEARNIQRMAEAKRAFLDGDPQKAREILAGCEFVPHRYYCLSNEGFLQHVSLNWQLEADDFAAALQRYAGTDWKPDERIEIAARIARAYIRVGQRSAGLAFLRDLRSLPGISPSLLGRQFLRLGALDDAGTLLREASIIAAEAATSNPRSPLPVSVARMQLASGNRDDAIETLRRLHRFKTELEYDLQPPRPPDIPAEQWDPRAKLTPAAERWIMGRFGIVETLAWAGLDSEAFAFLDEQPINDALVLRGIVSGQARRGDFASALKTLERIQGSALRISQTWHRPLPDRLEPTGANSYQLRELPIDPLDENAKQLPFYLAAAAIAKYAAYFGNENMFRRACEINREVNPNPSIRNACPISVLRHLANAGRVGAALEYVSSLHEPPLRTGGLRFIAEGMAGVPDPLASDDYPLRP